MWCPCPGAVYRLTRRRFLQGGAALAVAGCAPSASRAQKTEARSLLERNISVDLHSHSGLNPGISKTTLGEHLDRIGRGRLKLAVLAAVADGPVIQPLPSGDIAQVREPNPGELYTSTYLQLSTFRKAIDEGRLIFVRAPGDLERVSGGGTPGAILAVEGGDFLEGRLDRVQEAHDRGVRSIQLTHYRINELGDVQTGPPLHRGLSRFGRDVIREMNRLGMVVDVAHATFDGVRAAVDVSDRPMILSHTVLAGNTPFPLALRPEHVQLVARHGGVVGVWPVSIDAFDFHGFIDHVQRLVEVVGVDHVGIGTDMDGIPVGALFTDYTEWPSIPAALLARGYRPDDVVKVMGGNVLRVLKAVIRA